MSRPARFVSRYAWGAGARVATPQNHPIPDPWGVTFHWEGPHMGDHEHRECAGIVRTIQRFHKETRGWADIAYSALVCRHGYVFEGRGVNVQTAANGTSSIGGNDHWYAVCYMGGVGDPFTDAAREGYREAVRWLRSEGRAGARVNGHRDHHSTQCPGDAIYAWLRSVDWSQLDSSSTPTTEEEGDDMPKPDDLWSFEIKELDADTPKVDRAPAGKILAQTHNRAGDAREIAREALKISKANADKLDAILERLEADK